MLRYGRDIQPRWERDSVIGPQAAEYEIVGVAVSTDADMYIYGFTITAGESNSFYIQWESDGSTKQYMIDFGSKGTVHYDGTIPINEGHPANRRRGSAVTKVSIHAVGAMGGGINYSAAVLVGEIVEAT